MLYPTEEDVIIIDGLRVDAIIGIDDWERVMTQAIIIDMALFTDVTDVAQTQDLSQGVNYKAVCEQVSKWVQDKKFELLETLVEYVSKQLLDNWPISKVRFTALPPPAFPLPVALCPLLPPTPSSLPLFCCHLHKMGDMVMSVMSVMSLWYWWQWAVTIMPMII